MDPDSHLVTVDIDANVVQIAQRYLSHDPKVTFQVMDGAAFLERSAPGEFDFIYADAWPGKFTHLDLALSLLRIGGIYFVDDLLPQESWPDGHAPKVSALIADLAQRERIAAPFLTRTMRLAHLAPDLVEAILDSRQPPGLTLEALRDPLPTE